MYSAEIPKEGDVIFIQCEFYTGDAIVDYVDTKTLYQDHFLPIQVEAEDTSSHTGRRIFRVSLTDILGTQKEEVAELDYTQGSLFDEY